MNWILRCILEVAVDKERSRREIKRKISGVDPKPFLCEPIDCIPNIYFSFPSENEILAMQKADGILFQLANNGIEVKTYRLVVQGQ
ncbi:MAG: hypothetical protein V1804_01250 [Patescibacteria group bacterium]